MNSTQYEMQKRAIEWLKMAGQQVTIEQSSVQLLLLLFFSQWFSFLHVQNNVDALLKLGDVYFNGYGGIDIDYKKAAEQV